MFYLVHQHDRIPQKRQNMFNTQFTASCNRAVLGCSFLLILCLSISITRDEIWCTHVLDSDRKWTKESASPLASSLFHRWPACPTSSSSRWSRWCRRRRTNPTPAYKNSPPTETTTAAPTDSGCPADRTVTEPENSRIGHTGPPQRLLWTRLHPRLHRDADACRL